VRAIWKFVLDPDGEVFMPKGAEVLSVGVQGQDVCLWAIVETEPSIARETRKFLPIMTGGMLERGSLGKFVGTTVLGGLVIHVFEVAR